MIMSLTLEPLSYIRNDNIINSCLFGVNNNNTHVVIIIITILNCKLTAKFHNAPNSVHKRASFFILSASFFAILKSS